VVLIFRTIASLAIEIAYHSTLPRFNAAARRRSPRFPRLVVFQLISLIAPSGDSIGRKVARRRAFTARPVFIRSIVRAWRAQDLARFISGIYILSCFRQCVTRERAAIRPRRPNGSSPSRINRLIPTVKPRRRFFKNQRALYGCQSSAVKIPRYGRTMLDDHPHGRTTL